MTVYLTLAEILAIHDAQIARHGGSTGVRDRGLIEVALFRPQTGYYSDLIGEAAAMWESLSQNHPFIDGNKRTAFDAVCTFLRMNGWAVVAEQDATKQRLAELYATGQFNFGNLEDWLRANARKF